MLSKKYLFVVLFVIPSMFSFFISAPHRKMNIVFIGDSITQGADIFQAPPAFVESYFIKKRGAGQVTVSNQGVSGCTTTDFLPQTGTHFKEVEKAADAFYSDKHATMIFSIMLGTNDSAMEGTLGAPVSADTYEKNMKTIIDKLINKFPRSKFIIHHPTWYSPNTYNRAKYLQEGLDRLQSYSAVIRKLVADYSRSNKGHVFEGDKSAFNYFKKNHLTLMEHENGQQGIFYLHPTKEGSEMLANFWARAIEKIR